MAERYFLPAPLVAVDAEELEMLRRQLIYKKVIQIAEKTDVAFIGIGPVSQNCPLQRDGFMSDKILQEAIDNGAVGEYLGHLFNEEGKLLDNDFNLRNAGITLPIPPKGNVVALSGGHDRHQAIQAALKGQWLNGLVTDAQTAEFLLEINLK